MKLHDSTRSILNMFIEKFNEDDKLYRASKDALFPNGEPLNILKACYILENSAVLVRIKMMLPVTYEVLLRDLEELSGYSVAELCDKVPYPTPNN